MVRQVSRASKGGSAPAARTIQSVDRAVGLLKCLGAAKEGLSLTQLAGSLDLAPQTAQSLLRTLQHHGWVDQPTPRGSYRLGPGLAEVYRHWRAGQDRVDLARPVVEELSAGVGEYVVLAEWTGGGLMPLLQSYPDRELGVRGESFVPERIHTMATGKMLLATLDEARRKEIVATLPLPPRGPNSVTDPEVLLDQLASIREAGVAVCVEEAVEGIVAVAVEVSRTPGQPPAALGISLPAARDSSRRRTKLIAHLREASGAIADAWA
jgi:IclR family transcriptional regulator, acetate operon repressor